MRISWSVNGCPSSSGSCGGGRSVGMDAEESFRSYGVRLGSRGTLTATIGPGPDLPAGAAAGSGTVLAAVYQQVPPEDYPLAPRPTTLCTLAAPAPNAVTVWGSRTAGAVSSTTLTMHVTREDGAVVSTVAPGELGASADGQVVGRCSSWTWGGRVGTLPLGRTWLSEHRVTVPPSGAVQLTITTRRFVVPGWTVVTGSG